MMYASCVESAANAYGMSPPAIEAVIAAPPSIGTVGPMHVPGTWLPILKRVGFQPGRVVSDPCENIAAGTWILAFQHLRGESQNEPQKIASEQIPIPSGKLPSGSGVSGSCIDNAAKEYKLSSTLLRGILETEGGKVGGVHYNENGTYDMGPAQINSIWLPKLEAAGYSRREIINNGCVNVHIGAWILAQDMQGANPSDTEQFWRHVGDYNSATPYWNKKYAMTVWRHVAK